MSDSAPLLLLLDGSWYLYRAFYAMPDLRNAEGQPTGALYGFINMTRRLRSIAQASHAACVFDSRGAVLREQWLPSYKAQRAKMPEDLQAQIAPILEVLPLLGWRLLQQEGHEADDLIAALARAGCRAGFAVRIISGDKDLAQLVGEDGAGSVTLWTDLAQPPIDAAGVFGKYGVQPGQIVDYLALTGDASDNIPGVAQCGPVRARQWLAQYGSLQNLLAHAAEISGKAGEYLRAGAETAQRNLQLVRLLDDETLQPALAANLPHWPLLEDLAWGAPQSEALRNFYQRFGFKNWLKEMTAPGATPEPAQGPPLLRDAQPEEITAQGALWSMQALRQSVVEDEAELRRWLGKLAAAPLVALHLHCGEAMHPMRAQARMLTLCLPEGEGQRALCLSLTGAEGAARLALLGPWLADAQRTKLAWDIKQTEHVLRAAGCAPAGLTHDIGLMAYVLEAHQRRDPASLVMRHLRAPLPEEDAGSAGQSGVMAGLALALHQTLWPQLQAQSKLQALYEKIECPLALLLRRMEQSGVLLSCERLAAHSAEVTQTLAALEREAHTLAGMEFNLASPKQIGAALFGKLQLPILKKTASGAASTDEETLQQLALDYPLPKLLLTHRGLAKLKNTYLDKLPLWVDAEDARLHTQFAQDVAVTGRLSSHDPNLQNIPIRTAEGRRVRHAFIAPPGHQIVSADYSQIELRLAAHLAGEGDMIAAFHSGADIHRATAAEIFGIAPGEVGESQRSAAKAINFGLIYGMSAFGLAQNLGITQTAARQYMQRYFARYPKLQAAMQANIAAAKTQGYVETLWGRRRTLPDINSRNATLRSMAEREAINSPVQGSAADLIKLAMLHVQSALDTAGLKTRMILQVHDELLFEAPEAEVAELKRLLPQWMAEVATLSVPLLAEVGAGADWGEAH